MSELPPTEAEPLSPSALARVDRLCDKFEDAWQQGQRPRLEDYLGDALGEERDELLRWLIPLDVTYRRQHDQTPEIRDYLELSPTLSVDWLAGVIRPGVLLAERYQFGEKIGVGGIAEVHRGHDRCLDRPVAAKVLLEKYQHHADMVRRFQNEARITSRLQHPGIVPIHDLGLSADGRPCFTMKLVQGRTLAALLKERTDPTRELPRFLSIFEQICQTLAYAHAQGVIHRDLKPANVMVGAFGEVQVMDWGLAKALVRTGDHEAAAAPAGGPAAASSSEETVDPGFATLEGQALGTLAYMPPEQARGELKRVDERSDVFGLGAILCTILTGQPPFTGKDNREVFAKAKACDHAEALSRLDGCGADADLLRLAKACLAAEPADRPRDAGAVTREVTVYLAGVQERLRAAERERAAAQARAEEARRTAAAERQARRRMVGAALAGLLLVVGAGSGAWWQQRKQEQADQAVRNGLAQAELLEKQAQEAPLEPGKYHQAVEAARVAAHLAEGASDSVRGRAEELVARLEREEAAAERDRRLLTALLEVHGPREGPKFSRDDKGMLMTLAEPTAEEQFASAFRDWGLDVDAVPLAEAVARLKARPAVVVAELIAALDEWASQRRQDRKLKTKWRRVADLAAALDDDPGSLRPELREILARGRLPVERALGVLSAALRPVPVPVAMPLGEDRARLRRLAEKIDPASEPVLGLLTLTRALRVAGEEALAERLLRAALTARPREVVLYYTLGQLLSEQKPPRWAEAVEFYRAARGLRPDLGVELAEALRHGGHAREGLALLARMVQQRPDNPYPHFHQGFAFHSQGKYAEAAAAYRQAITLKPDYAKAHHNLGMALNNQRKYVEAEAACRKAIALQPDFADAYIPDLADTYIHLGNALNNQGKYAEAEAAYRKAIALKPDYAGAYNNLGNALNNQRKYAEAEAAYRKAIALEPDDAGVYSNLGNALNNQGKFVEAEATCRKTIALKPDYADAYNNLGNALNNQRKYVEAEVAFRKAIALKPDFAEAYNNLGAALAEQRKYAEAEAACRQAVALKPDYAEAYNNLGSALSAQGKYAEAEAACRKAIALKPDLAEAYYNLGIALAEQRKYAEAEAACRKAVALKPDYAEAYNNLGIALAKQRKYAEAEAAYRKAIALKPDYASAYNNLGIALDEQGKFVEAEAAYRKAIALKADFVAAYCNLGVALGRQKRYAEAEAACRQAIALKPDYAEAYNNLGNALNNQGKYAEAEAAYRKAIALKPDDAEAHCNLGGALRRQGRFTESLAAYRRGHELGSKRSGWRYPSLQWVRRAEHLVELEKKLPAVLQGQASPANAGDAIILAQMCQQYKKLHAGAARLYADAFTGEPKLAADLQQQHRYTAACSAALTAAGQGEDARLLPDKVAAMFRNWALGWLRDDLKAYAQLAGRNNPQTKQAIRQRLLRWQSDADLASVRDRAALERLPDNERAAWQALWQDVAALLKRT